MFPDEINSVRLCLSPFESSASNSGDLSPVSSVIASAMALPESDSKSRLSLGVFSSLGRSMCYLCRLNNIAFVTHQIRYCGRLSYNPPGTNTKPWQPDVCQGDVASSCGKSTRLRLDMPCRKSLRISKATSTEGTFHTKRRSISGTSCKTELILCQVMR